MKRDVICRAAERLIKSRARSFVLTKLIEDQSQPGGLVFILEHENEIEAEASAEWGKLLQELTLQSSWRSFLVGAIEEAVPAARSIVDVTFTNFDREIQVYVEKFFNDFEPVSLLPKQVLS